MDSQGAETSACQLSVRWCHLLLCLFFPLHETHVSSFNTFLNECPLVHKQTQAFIFIFIFQRFLLSQAVELHRGGGGGMPGGGAVVPADPADVEDLRMWLTAFYIK